MDNTAKKEGFVPSEGEMIYPSHQLHFRSLRANEVELRPVDTSNGKVKLLLYKDARSDRRILDEVVGSMNWQSDYFEERGCLFCKIGIRNPQTDEWIWKADTGSESNIEAEKGLASDAFKRAAFSWGVGSELYSAPNVTFPIEEKDMYNNKFCQSFSVSEMTVDNGVITSLCVVDKWGKLRFSYKAGKEAPVQDSTPTKQEVVTVPASSTTKGNMEPLDEDLMYREPNDEITYFCKKKKSEPGVDMRQLTNFHKFYLSPSKDNPEKSIAETFNNLDPEKLWVNWMKKAK